MKGLMDMSKHIIRSPTLAQLNEEIQAQIKETVQRNAEQLLCRIAAGEGLSAADLRNKYLDTHLVASVGPISTKKNRKVVSPDKRCCAKTSSGEQCSRSRNEENEFCGSHRNKQPYGIIQEPDKT
jgi:hypothetical protein